MNSKAQRQPRTGGRKDRPPTTVSIVTPKAGAGKPKPPPRFKVVAGRMILFLLLVLAYVMLCWVVTPPIPMW